MFFFCNGPAENVDFYLTDVYFEETAPSTSPSSSPTYHPTTAAPTFTGAHIHPPIGYTAIAVPGEVRLGISGIGQILLLSQVITTNGVDRTPVPAGRSYEGHDWEAVDPIHLSFDCSSGVYCLVTLPSVPGETVEYTIDTYQPDVLDSDQMAWRLLQQATFGPTMESITHASSLTASEWVVEQMSIAPTSHRAHFRQRTSSRLRQNTYSFGIHDVCEPGSRWNNYTFSMRDIGNEITEEYTASNTYALYVDGIVRTEVSAQLQSSMSLGLGPWKICEVNEYVGGNVIVSSSDGDCSEEDERDSFANPSVSFVQYANDIEGAYLVDLNPVRLDTKILDSLPGECSFDMNWPHFVRDINTNEYYVSDRRVQLQDNTFDAAHTVERQDAYRQCPVVPKTFLNEAHCVPRTDCGAPRYSSANFVLNAENIRKFYTLEGLFVYRMDIPVDENETPDVCDLTIPHRFVRRTDTGGCGGEATVLDESILDAVEYHINAAVSLNPDTPVLDVEMTTDRICSDPSRSTVGAKFEVGSSCWQHSHPLSWNVYDMSSWAILHPGNPAAFNEWRRNPIAAFAERENNGPLEDSVTLVYPSWHDKAFFTGRLWRFPYIGRWGENVDFADLPTSVLGPNVADDLGSTLIGYDGVFELCGSVNEVSNDPIKGNQYNGYHYGEHGARLDFDQGKCFLAVHRKGAITASIEEEF